MRRFSILASSGLMSGVVEVACVRIVRFGPGLNFHGLMFVDKDFVKNSNLKLLLPRIVVVHDTHVVVIGLVVHDQAGES